jgi:hypothetical protein
MHGDSVPATPARERPCEPRNCGSADEVDTRKQSPAGGRQSPDRCLEWQLFRERGRLRCPQAALGDAFYAGTIQIARRGSAKQAAPARADQAPEYQSFHRRRTELHAALVQIPRGNVRSFGLETGSLLAIYRYNRWRLQVGLFPPSMDSILAHAQSGSAAFLQLQRVEPYWVVCRGRQSPQTQPWSLHRSC